MPDLYDDLRRLVRALEAEHAEYALCGGLAMAVHGHIRATIDIDLLVPERSIEGVKRVCRELGFSIEARPMIFADGRVRIERMSRSGSADPELSIDLLVVTPATENPWSTRSAISWEGLDLVVVSAAGLIELKRLRGSAQDLADVERLESRDGG